MASTDKLGPYIQQLMATVIESDDDFGFGETTSFYQDMKKYNPVSGSDENL